MALLEQEEQLPEVGPLRILQLKKDSSEVEILTENLDKIGLNLQHSGATLVCIVSVMGTYRTGKSFLLDLLMRCLKRRAAEARAKAELEARELAAKAAAADDYIVGNHVGNDVGNHVEAIHPESNHDEEPGPCAEAEPRATGSTWRFEDESVEKPPPPAWVLEGNATRVSEGSKSDEKQEGFAWRPGKDKCTQGIWLWSSPFVFTDKDGRGVAVLLMDTQGAWDDTMTKAQSATIFGLTALLSSKLIYNIQNRVEEDKLENMDYITTFAQSVCSDLPGNHAPFGHLELLVRDWANYEAGFDVEQCKAQMADHLDDHLNPQKVPQDAIERVERLQSTFHSIGSFGLPHPGLKVTKPSFAGEIDAIDRDFLHLLDQFTQGFFGGEFPRASAPLGCEISVGSFKQIVMNFAEAFRENAQDMAIGLREAFVKVEMMTCREELIKRFREQMLRIAPETSVLDPDDLQRDTERLQASFTQEFVTKLKPFKLKEPEELKYLQEFTGSIREVVNNRAAANKQQVEGATVKLVASPVVGCGAYFLLVHHWILYLVMGVGAWLHAKKWATKNKTEMYNPVVLEGIASDSKEFFIQRYKDVQAMQIAVARLNPNNAMETLMKATQHVGVIAASASAAVSTLPQASGQLQRGAEAGDLVVNGR